MTRYIINSLPKAGNNLLATYLEETEGVKRSSAFGISSMSVLQPTRASAINRGRLQTYDQGIIAGLFMPVELSKGFVLGKLNQLQDNEYMICHMPAGFGSFIRSFDEYKDIKIVQIRRPLIEILESMYHYIHSEVYHPLHEVFNQEKDANTKYKWLIDGKFWADYTLLSIFDAVQMLEPEDPWYEYEDLYNEVKGKKDHVFRKGTPGNYTETMPEEIQEYFKAKLWLKDMDKPYNEVIESIDFMDIDINFVDAEDITEVINPVVCGECNYNITRHVKMGRKIDACMAVHKDNGPCVYCPRCRNKVNDGLRQSYKEESQ